MDKKVKVINMTNGRVVVNVPDLKLRRVWERKGAVKTIPYDVLEEAKYDIAVQHLLEEGILYIEDMEIKKSLELEPEDAVEPVNIIVLTDEDKEELLSKANLKNLVEKMKTLKNEQRQSLVEYAIEKEITDIQITDILKRATGIDVISAVKLNRDAAEGV
jgi:hypothetical protein